MKKTTYFNKNIYTTELGRTFWNKKIFKSLIGSDHTYLSSLGRGGAERVLGKDSAGVSRLSVCLSVCSGWLAVSAGSCEPPAIDTEGK